MEVINNTYTPQECKDFISWFETAKTGELYKYFSGTLAMYQSLQVKTPIKELTWKMAVEGKIYLFQKKVLEDDFDYLAYKVGVRNKKLIPKDYWSSRKYYKYRSVQNGSD